MEFHFVTPHLRQLDNIGAELIACCVWEDERPLRGLAGLLDWRLCGRLSRLAKGGFLRGESGEVVFLPGRPRLAFEKVLVFGLGPTTAFTDGVFKEQIKGLLRALEGLNVRRAVVELPGRAASLVEPERAAEVVLECAGDSPAHDSWWLVEEAEGQRRIRLRTQDERRRVQREDRLG